MFLEFLLKRIGIFIILVLFNFGCTFSKPNKLLFFLPMENAVAGLVLSQTSIQLAEGETSSFTARLGTKPAENVTVQCNFSSSYLQLNSANSLSLSFTPDNWEIAQTISLSAVENTKVEGQVESPIQFGFTSNDSVYNTMTSDPVTVSITDNDTAGITVTETSGSTSVMEGINTDTYTIVLNNEPLSDVTVQINYSGSQLKVNSSVSGSVSLTFNSTNWSTPQTVSVEAVFDNATEGNHTSTITHSVSSSNQYFNNLSVNSVTVNITDNEGTRLTSSFQSGTANMTSATLTVVLGTPVNATKSFVYCNMRYSLSRIDNAVTCQLSSDGANVILQSGVAEAGTVVNWYVAEFATGALIERGSSNFTNSVLDYGGTHTLTNTFDPNRTFIISYTRTDGSDSGVNKDEQRTAMLQLSNSNTIAFSREEGGTAVTVEWQVIQLDGAKVQSGTSTIANGSSSTTATITTANLANSALIFNSKAGSTVSGSEESYYLRGRYNSSTELQFGRGGSSGTIEISWFAIEMVDGTNVQSGNLSVASTSTVETASLSPAVDTGKTMIIMSSDTTGTNQSYQDSGTFSTAFTNSTTIQFERYSHESHSCNVSWFTLEFQ